MTDETHNRGCPLESVHRRMDDAHRLWHQALAAYFDPDEFRVAAQSLIQVLRTVTWLLQNQKAKFKEFDAWYGPWQDRMKADATMRWLVDARNQIEKRGDLESKSKVRAEVLASYLRDIPIVEVEAGLFEALDAVLQKLPKELLEKQIIEHGVLKIDRRWVANSLPDQELLEALAYVYGRLSLLIDDAHTVLGLPIPTTMTPHEGKLDPFPGGGPSDGRLPCMVAHDQRMSLLIALKTGERLEMETRSSVASKEELLKAKERYGPIEDLKREDPDPSFRNLAQFFFGMARRIILTDGYHGPIALLFANMKPITQIQTNYADRREKYLAARAIAAEVERHGADALMLVGEIWTAEFKPGDPLAYPSDMPQRKEHLALHACSASGEQFSLTAEIVRDGEKITLGDTMELTGGVAAMFEPVREVWRKQIKK